MISPLRDWDRFWFQPQTARALGLFRIVLGIIIIYSFALFAKDIVIFFSDAGLLTTQTLEKVMGRDFHTLLMYVRSPIGVVCFLILLFAAALCFTIGYATRVNAILLFALVVSFHERNNLVLNGGDTVIRTMLFFFMFAPAGAAFSVDGLLSQRKFSTMEAAKPLLVAPWAQRMMQVQVTLIYFATVYAKIRGPLWNEGVALYYVFGLTDFHVRGVEQLMNYPLLYSPLTFVTLIGELTLPFLLWFRATRLYAIAIGLFLHGWMMIFMTLPVFPILMISTYIPFISEAEIDDALEWIRRRFREK